MMHLKSSLVNAAGSAVTVLEPCFQCSRRRNSMQEYFMGCIIVLGFFFPLDLIFSKYSLISPFLRVTFLALLTFLLFAGYLINCLQRMSLVFPNFHTAHLQTPQDFYKYFGHKLHPYDSSNSFITLPWVFPPFFLLTTALQVSLPYIGKNPTTSVF